MGLSETQNVRVPGVSDIRAFNKVSRFVCVSSANCNLARSTVNGFASTQQRCIH